MINRRHAVLEAMSRAEKPHRNADFKRKTEHQQPRRTVIDALLMMWFCFCEIVSKFATLNQRVHGCAVSKIVG